MPNVKILIDLFRADGVHFIPKGSVLPSSEPGRVVLPCGSRATVAADEIEATDEPVTQGAQRRLPCGRCDGTGKVMGIYSRERYECSRCRGDGLRRERPAWGWSLQEGRR